MEKRNHNKDDNLSRNRKWWTENEDELLKSLWPDLLSGDITLDEIAEMLCRKVWSIKNRAHKLSCPVLSNRWTEEEEKYLSFRWGVFGLEVLAKNLKRTPGSVLGHARAMGLGHVCRGKYLLSEVEKMTGYHASTIKIIAKRLGLKLQHIPQVTNRGPDAKPKKSVRYGIEQEEVDLIIEEMNRMKNPNRISSTSIGEWGTGDKPAVCRDCNTARCEHRARGLCAKCYRLNRISSTLHLYSVIQRVNDKTRVDYKEDGASISEINCSKESKESCNLLIAV